MLEEPSVSASSARKHGLRAILVREAPYFLVLTLALFGVAYTSVAKTPITLYWILLAPLTGVICVLSRWNEVEIRERRLQLIWMQALHWFAVLVAIELMFVADVNRMINADGAALVTLSVLALGTFTAGVHIASWRICLVGALLAFAVPAIAWLDQSALLIALVVAVIAALAAPIVFRAKRDV